MSRSKPPVPDLLDIHRAFAATTHGQNLAAQVRYAKYKPDSISNERWVDLLGPDVNNLEHMSFTYELARDFVRDLRHQQPDLLSTEEEALIQVAAIIHDWGESKTGDKSYGDKTAADEAAEEMAFDTYLHEFYQGDAINLIKQARKEVIFDHAGDQGKLGRIFNAIERVGYMHTTLRAYQLIATRAAVECEAGFKWLVADVFSLQPLILLDYANQYTPVYQYLRVQDIPISAAFVMTEATPTVFNHYDDSVRATRKAQFAQSLQAWRAWQRKNK